MTYQIHPMRALTIGAFSMYLFVCASAAAGARQAEGPSVWDGVFTAEQADRGATYFAQHCARCHGANLQGAESKALSGDRFWSDWQETTVDYLFGQISRNMPHSEDGSLAGTLGQSLYVDIVAHILHRNGFPAGSRALTPDSSAGVRIVRKEGPAELPADALAQVVGCLARGTGRTWQLTHVGRPVRVLATGAPDPTSAALGDRTIELKFVLTSLDKFVGQRVAATGRLIGAGGRDGLNVSTVSAVSQTCP